MYRRNGKQVLCNDQHFADAVSEEAAGLILDALNDHGRRWKPVEDDDLVEVTEADLLDKRNDLIGHRHVISRQSDEYACICGKRWPVEEGEEHP